MEYQSKSTDPAVILAIHGLPNSCDVEHRVDTFVKQLRFSLRGVRSIKLRLVASDGALAADLFLFFATPTRQVRISRESSHLHTLLSDLEKALTRKGLLRVFPSHVSNPQCLQARGMYPAGVNGGIGFTGNEALTAYNHI